MAAETVIDPRVSEIYELEAQIAELKARADALKGELIEEGEGTYLENDLPDARKLVVVIPDAWSVSYDLYPAAAAKAFLEAKGAKKSTPALAAEFAEAQEARARELAGDEFKALFERRVSYAPVDGFEKLVPKMLATAKGELSAKGRDLLLLCQVRKAPPAAHVKLPDKPKA